MAAGFCVPHRNKSAHLYYKFAEPVRHHVLNDRVRNMEISKGQADGRPTHGIDLSCSAMRMCFPTLFTV